MGFKELFVTVGELTRPLLFQVEVKKAIPKEECRPPSNLPAATPTKKVFLGGLPLEVTKEQLLDEMARYGDLIDAQIMTDKVES